MNYDAVRKYVDRFAKEIETQPISNNELSACQDVYSKWLAGLQLESIVELGAGVGTLLNLFPPEVARGGISLGAEGNMALDDMNTPPFEDGTFDLAIARHALEHSLMPLIMLCEMARITKKYVLIIVPTCSEEMANYPNHYSVFTPVALKALFKRAGLAVIKEELNVPLYGNITEDRFLLEEV